MTQGGGKGSYEKVKTDTVGSPDGDDDLLRRTRAKGR